MLLSAIVAVALAQQQIIPHKLVLKTEAKSPHSLQATLIQDKRKAFEFFLLVKKNAPKPEAIKKLNWDRTNVIIVYPGLVQTDAKISLKSVKRFGKKVQVTLESHRGISSGSYYPIFVATIPKVDRGVEVNVLDTSKLRSGVKSRRRSLGA